MNGCFALFFSLRRSFNFNYSFFSVNHSHAQHGVSVPASQMRLHYQLHFFSGFLFSLRDYVPAFNLPRRNHAANEVLHNKIPQKVLYTSIQ